jgi:excisionase family DNA binding protein
MSKLLSINDAADTLGISTFTLRRFLKRGVLRSVRVGRRVLLPETEVLRIVDEGCGYTTAVPGNGRGEKGEE